MLSFGSKIFWPCYMITFVVYMTILLWGLASGRLLGSVLAYRFLVFYMLMPGIAGLGGLILGIKNAKAKWMYPILCGGLSYIIPHILFRSFFTVASIPYLVFPFLSATLGLIVGMIIFKLHIEHKIKLKKLTKIALATTTAIALIHIIHAFTLDRVVVYTEVSLTSPNLPPKLNGYRVAFLTDTHFMTEERMWEIVHELNQRELDLVTLGGDFAIFTPTMKRTIEVFSHIQATDGIFGVEGNHDVYSLIFEAMEANGITPLSNSGYHIREGFFLAGVEDLWNRNPNISIALEGSYPEDFVLLISHNPDVTMRQDTTRVDLTLSGHTHGGQVTFFGIWAPYFTLTSHLTAYGQRFRSGWALSYDETPVFVSRGVGEYLPRVFARPEVILVTLYSE